MEKAGLNRTYPKKPMGSRYSNIDEYIKEAEKRMQELDEIMVQAKELKKRVDETFNL